MTSPAAGAWLVAAVLWSNPLRAADWGGTLAATSDYVFRGISRTDHGASAQAGLHVRSAERWFASVWASSLAPSPGSLGRVELNLNAGRGWDLSDDWAASAGWVRYLYPDATDRGRFDWDELSASLIYADRFVLTASVAPSEPRLYAPGTSERRRATAVEASWREPVAGAWSLLAAVGRYETSAPFSQPYLAWNMGLSAQVGGLELGLARFGIDAPGRRQFASAVADGRWVFSLAWRYAAN